MNATQPLIVLAAGGTGGHVFPAEALAESLMARGRRLALITDRRGQAFGGVLGRLDTHRIRAGGIAGRSLWKRGLALIDLGLGTLQAHALLGRMKPAAVVGFGGYASVPTMLAAILRKRPTLLHEQNAVLGRANRLLAGRVDRIATAFAQVEHVPTADAKVVPTGMPVRPAVAAMRDTAYPALDGTGPIALLVLGGSQGAKIFSSLIPAALALLPETLRRRLRVSQQCRPELLDETRHTYQAAGIEADLASFFHDVPERLAGAHLVIARAGASTVAEVSLVGRPAILVPYPHAIDDHQTANAHALDEAGGGWLMPEAALSPASLAARLESLFAHPETLAKAAACARAAGRPDAAQRLADAVDSLIARTAGGAP
ncbi:MAG: undecaprenyldiphospho-muramoylpentapeptide beta-N-acetylglucosaminyltransferase [Rhodospirillales bacterium]|nr:undecaprenyldiphospho-muramoylpentapeptide beta-N-acetylglucosaminyltransferase [Rhodospirillales bacterium]